MQSPILASLVVATSDVGKHLLGVSQDVKVAVYMDDISLSSDNAIALQDAYESTLEKLKNEGFAVSVDKLRTPASSIDIFNCDLSHGEARVTNARIEEFLATVPSQVAEDAFVGYCASVEKGNTP